MTEIETAPALTSALPNFIPVNQFPTYDVVQWGVDVPDLGDTQLVIHVDRLARLGRLAGFHSVAVTEAPNHPMDEQKDVQHTTCKLPKVTALIHGGQAGQLQSDVMQVVQTKHYLWPDCTIEITPPDFVCGAKGVPNNPARVWARHLDKSVKLGLYMAARQHLALDSSEFAKQMVAFEAANLSLIPLSGTIFMKAALGWLTVNQLVNMGEAVFINQFLGISAKERRFSFFYATQIDRLAALRLRLAAQRIIKTTSS